MADEWTKYVPRGEYEARPAEENEAIQTPVGAATTREGDWVVRHRQNEDDNWNVTVYDGDYFQREFVGADEDNTAVPEDINEDEEDIEEFDPNDYNVAEVKEYVTSQDLSVEELQRIYDAEESGKNRSGLMTWLADYV